MVISHPHLIFTKLKQRKFPDLSYRYPPPAMKFLQVLQLPSPSGMSSEPAMVQGDDWRNPADHRLRFLVRVNRTLEPPGLKNSPKIQFQSRPSLVFFTAFPILFRFLTFFLTTQSKVG
ncbi:uncharacterized protein LOC117180522 [Belonocnema kinseyi]|uniref:uncharacterized protein LOC117180522 n=1 Tax=Belonocnema kinseyi TaxID=2817044 RepID=UPI00143D8E44|nr:uncharacterized protein LOC117180522 [Belonocnema kinseyi]